MKSIQRNPVLKHPAVIFDRLVTLSQMPVVAAHDPGFSAWLVERRGPILAMIGEVIKERRGESVQASEEPRSPAMSPGERYLRGLPPNQAWDDLTFKVLYRWWGARHESERSDPMRLQRELTPEQRHQALTTLRPWLDDYLGPWGPYSDKVVGWDSMDPTAGAVRQVYRWLRTRDLDEAEQREIVKRARRETSGHRHDAFSAFAARGISPDRVYRVAPYMDQTDLQHPEMLVRVRPGPDPETAAILVEYMDMHRQAPPRGPFSLDAKSVTGREAITNLLRHIDASKSLPDFPSVVAPPKRKPGPALPINTVVRYKGRRGKRYVVVSAHDYGSGPVVDLVALSGGVSGSGPSQVPIEELEVIPGAMVTFEGVDGGQERWRQYAGRMASAGHGKDVVPWSLRAAQEERAQIASVDEHEAWAAAQLRKYKPGGTPATLTAGEINKELDKIDVIDREVGQHLIAAGRGYERPTDMEGKQDPLSLLANAMRRRYGDLYREIQLRYGPGAPSRLPSRGFGPRQRE